MKSSIACLLASAVLVALSACTPTISQSTNATSSVRPPQPSTQSTARAIWVLTPPPNGAQTRLFESPYYQGLRFIEYPDAVQDLFLAAYGEDQDRTAALHLGETAIFCAWVFTLVADTIEIHRNGSQATEIQDVRHRATYLVQGSTTFYFTAGLNTRQSETLQRDPGFYNLSQRYLVNTQNSEIFVDTCTRLADISASIDP